MALLSKLSPPVDHTEDIEMISRMNSETADDCVFNDARDVKSDREFHAERARSAPGIIETSIISRRNR